MAAVLKERLPRRVIELLKEFGRVADLMGFNAYLVGGLVRDILLKRDNLDVDIVVEGDGIKFAQEFAAQREVKVRSHKKFGTVVLVFPDGFKVDVATARIEYYDFPAAPPDRGDELSENGSLPAGFHHQHSGGQAQSKGLWNAH